MPILPHEEIISIPLKNEALEGNLVIPKEAKGIILFAHGSGSSRMSPRNQLVAHFLNKAGFATLLFDLLTKEEERIDSVTGELRFNIDLLTDRLIDATDWVAQNPSTKSLKIGYFGASTGAAATLLAALQRSQEVKAIVSRGGRPDLAEGHLKDVQAPTLLIVGGRDYAVIHMNESALEQLTCTKELLIIPGATHLFEEPGTLEEVAEAAKNWFKTYMG